MAEKCHVSPRACATAAAVTKPLLAAPRVSTVSFVNVYSSSITIINLHAAAELDCSRWPAPNCRIATMQRPGRQQPQATTSGWNVAMAVSAAQQKPLPFHLNVAAGAAAGGTELMVMYPLVRTGEWRP